MLGKHGASDTKSEQDELLHIGDTKMGYNKWTILPLHYQTSKSRLYCHSERSEESLVSPGIANLGRDSSLRSE